MIAGKIFRVEFFPTILTGMVIPREDVSPGKLYISVITSHEPTQPYNGRLLYSYRHTLYLPFVFL
jgi:hypothetical protein